jgi:hypothetical protein
MAQTLRVPQSIFRDNKHRSEQHWTNLPDEVTPGEFEQSVDRDHPIPVAIWNGGFTKAVEKLSQIINWLGGDRNSL